MQKCLVLLIFFLTVLISLSSGQQERAEESGLLFPISKLGMWGYINKAGEVVIGVLACFYY